MLTALQRVNPVEIEDDPKLNNLIGIVPFGIPETPPTHSQQALKGVIDGINEDAFLLIWGGSISNWFDMETLIKAMKEVSKQEQKIKLFFMGTKHPNPLLPDMEICHQTLNLTKELGLFDKVVFFGKDWVPYEERANYLLEADCGVSTHLTHIESRFSFRTRIVDYIWCGMPTILTEGDFFSEKIKENGGGIIVPEKDPHVLGDAILKMYRDRPFREKCSEAMKKMGEAYRWSEVAKPLLEFISKNLIDKKSKHRYMATRLDEAYHPGEDDFNGIDPIWHAHLEEFYRVVNASLAYKTYRLFKKILGN
jgi:glycosyltransferase involved in cell wall biosynthesis